MSAHFPAADTFLAEAEAELGKLDALLGWIDEQAATGENASDAARTVRAIVIGKEIDAIYSGIERALRVLLKGLDGAVPEGPESHRELLAAAVAANPPARPAIIGSDTHGLLDRRRGFRHLVRHGYGSTLRLELTLENLAVLRAAVPLVRRDVDALRAVLVDVDAKAKPRRRRPR